MISANIKYKEMAFSSQGSSPIDYMFIQSQGLILFIPLKTAWIATFFTEEYHFNVNLCYH